MNGGFPSNHDLPSNISYQVLPICILSINHNILKYRAWFPLRFLILNLISLKGLGWVSSFGNRKKYSRFSGCVQLVQCWASWYHHWRLSREIIGPAPILVRSSQTKHSQSSSPKEVVNSHFLSFRMLCHTTKLVSPISRALMLY